MVDLPGRPAYEPDDRAGAEQEQGWGSPVPAEYGSLRAVSSRRPAEDGSDAPPDGPAAPPERSVVASLLRRIQGDSPGSHGLGSRGLGSRGGLNPFERRSGLAGDHAAPASVPLGNGAVDGAPGPHPTPETYQAADRASAAADAELASPHAPTQAQPRRPAEAEAGPGAGAGPGATVGQPRLPAEAGPGPGPGAGAGAGATVGQPRLPAEAGPGAGAGAGATVGQPRLPAEAGPGPGGRAIPAVPPGEPVQGPGIDPTALGGDLGVSGLYGRRARRGVRPGRTRTRATIRHLDILTVIRVSVVFWLVVLVSVVLASVLLWIFADAFGSLPSIEKSVRTLFSLKSFKLHPGQVALYTALGGLVISVVGIIANVLFALIYNLIADVVGGVRVELESFTAE